MPLVEVGSHCRGAIFLDASDLLTPALEDAVERVSRPHPGFHLGRYDVRAESDPHETVLEFARSAFRHACAVCEWDPALPASADGTPPPVA